MDGENQKYRKPIEDAISMDGNGLGRILPYQAARRRISERVVF